VDGTIDLLLAAAAALVAGAINALAGGGTLVTFPALLALGMPAVVANVTNTVALCPGYVGGTLAQKADLRGQGARLRRLLPAAALGGVLGGWLLLASGEKLFRGLVPWLILLASLLLAVQGRMRAWLDRRLDRGGGDRLERATWLPVGAAAVYGGYFGAGLSVIVLAALGLSARESLTRLNAAKQAIALVVNLAAAAFFLFSGQVAWTFAAVMAVGALGGGALGGRLAGRLPPTALRRTVVGLGLIVAAVYFARG